MAAYLTDRDCGDETTLRCDFCEEEADTLTPRISLYMGYLGRECATCADQEPGDSYYEDHGQNLHALQEASGGWRR